MKDLLEYIVKSIVSNPDEAEVEERESVDFPSLTILNIKVSEDDKGIIIGKRGRTINAIRDVMSINAIRSDKRIRVIVEDNQGNEKEKDVSDDDTQETQEFDEDILSDEV